MGEEKWQPSLPEEGLCLDSDWIYVQVLALLLTTK